MTECDGLKCSKQKNSRHKKGDREFTTAIQQQDAFGKILGHNTISWS